MNPITYSAYTKEAIKITLLCLLISAIFKLLGVNNKALLVIFNMAVMSSAAIYKVEPRHIKEVIFGCSVLILSVVLGGVIGYYFQFTAKILTIIYAGLAFYLPTNRTTATALMTSALTFLVFTVLPFTWQEGLAYLIDGLGILIIFILFHWIFSNRKALEIKTDTSSQPFNREQNKILAIIVMIALTVAWIINGWLTSKYQLVNIYWIELTVMLVVQGSYQKTIITSIKRILVNVVGALVAVVIFNHLLPADFLLHFITLTVFLFMIFFMGFSYVARVLFIELFVLGFASFLGTFHPIVAMDRVLLTLTGSIIVIIVTCIVYLMANRRDIKFKE